MHMNKKGVSVIIPVYGDWPSLERCIASVLKHTDFSSNELVLVNDRGPEHADIEKKIQKIIHGKKNVFYHANARNLGFLQNCNNAVDTYADKDNDILLLNSDAEVTEGYLEALQAVFVDDESIAAVSPRSNNATICTIPLWDAGVKKMTFEQSRKWFLKLSPQLPPYTISPVSHGFCMLVRRVCIDKIGLFDTIFGKGYGEEVDFCLRARKNGWECAISNRAYVYHLEARSFTPDQKKALIAENEKVVTKRYPNYRKEARDYRVLNVEKERKLAYGRLYFLHALFLRFRGIP